MCRFRKLDERMGRSKRNGEKNTLCKSGKVRQYLLYIVRIGINVILSISVFYSTLHGFSEALGTERAGKRYEAEGKAACRLQRKMPNSRQESLPRLWSQVRLTTKPVFGFNDDRSSCFL
jgi:hypothetical protein